MSDDTETTEPKYPGVKVQLSGRNGNVFSIMAAVSRALERAGVPSDEVNEYRNESMSGGYDHLLQTAMKWVTVL